MKFAFKKLLQNDVWLNDVVIETNENGLIESINENSQINSNQIAIPAFQNAHSHAFQYAMAGLAENHFSDSDFWSWREAMYQLALAISPEQIEKIAKMLYAEMLRHGYSNVAEFHYVHHDADGNKYKNLAEMGSHLINAAKKTGMNITIIPIFYQKGGFGKNPSENQRRFISNTIEDYFNLFEASKNACKFYENANIAVGIHSMRGVEPEIIKQVAENFPKDVPFHIHISEQLQEVEDCINYLNKRPVEWMLDNIELSERFHFVHATHLNSAEITGLADTKTNVILCPTTEGNLGDGIFPLKEFQNLGGNWCIGTDSHVSLNPFEELRLLDYGQRLISHKRNTFTDKNNTNSGKFAVKQAIINGRKAMNNFNEQFFAIGEPLNALIISDEHPLIATTTDENLLNTIIYSSDETMQFGTISNGKFVVENGKHFDSEQIFNDFRQTIDELKNR